MKRISVILLAAAAAWSCTKEPVVSEAPRRERPEASVPDNDDIVSGQRVVIDFENDRGSG